MPTVLTRLSRSAPTPDVLHAIRADDCHLAIWEREPLADFTPLIEGQPADLRFETTLPDLASALAAGLSANGFGGTTLHEAFIADVRDVAALYCAALDLACFELRLEVVRTDSCRKFHADYVSARLITTYVGEGTDWLEQSDAERVAAGEEPRRISRMAAFDVGLFKGKLATDRPAIHRSPPISATGGTRLLLVLNPAQKQFVDHADSVFSRPAQVP